MLVGAGGDGDGDYGGCAGNNDDVGTSSVVKVTGKKNPFAHEWHGMHVESSPQKTSLGKVDLAEDRQSSVHTSLACPHHNYYARERQKPIQIGTSDVITPFYSSLKWNALLKN